MISKFKNNFKSLVLLTLMAGFITSCHPETSEPGNKVIESPLVEGKAGVKEKPAAKPSPKSETEKKAAAKGDTDFPKVVLKTNKGDIVLELNAKKAPVTVKNFLQYVDDGFYDGVVFHRVMDGFMIQTGGFGLKKDGSIEQKKTRGTIQNEAKNGLKNNRGSVAMARLSDPHSAAAQFFINHADNNAGLDYPSRDGWGYTVFGKVIKGMDVVDAIAAVETTTRSLKARVGDSLMEHAMKNVPVENVVIESAKRVK